MRILIVEDETAAYENLRAILSEIDPELQIAGNTESIRQTIRWLKDNQAPDLVLMDIHLSDGSAFSIFESIDLETPVIFTTAYDEYAIEAFKVNSIDYLLKPIKVEDMNRALDKFRKLNRQDIMKYLAQMTHLTQLKPSPRFKDKLLIPVKDTLQPVDLNEISCFYTTDKNTVIYLNNGKSFPYSRTLEQIEASLNPKDFIRANKQFIVARVSVKNITIWFDSRLLVKLDIELPERIYVSKNKAAEFKAWMVRES
ncbi:MAG TPA: DNA-binding response regulator [Bacteroidales bacterium]|jgi:two-component system, LytTR family, response regulator LytT|nr:DNA-binding response regulator [Bacteroidales bacterium]HBZ20198.1 DNA-binding response regulator [Bacteroidales bacterium]